MKIYIGKDAVCGIQLTIDKVWRYVLSDNDIVTVRITDSEGHTLEKTYTKADIDSDTKMIKVSLTAEETALFHTGHAKITAYMNGLCVLPFKYIYVKEAL